MLQKAAEDRDFLNATHEKLQQENVLLEAKVSLARISVVAVMEMFKTA